MLADPRRLELPPEEAAVAGLATRLSDAPWTIAKDDFDRARAAGLSDATLLHVVLETGLFNYLNRVADATGIEVDYGGVLPTMPREDHDPRPRPALADWPEARRGKLAIGDRPTSAAIFEGWRAHELERDAPLTRRERDVIRLVAAEGVCDRVAKDELAAAAPASERERALAAYAAVLTRTPWRIGERHLAPLRALGLDDPALLDVISVAAFQDASSRIRLALSAS